MKRKFEDDDVPKEDGDSVALADALQAQNRRKMSASDRRTATRTLDTIIAHDPTVKQSDENLQVILAMRALGYGRINPRQFSRAKEETNYALTMLRFMPEYVKQWANRQKWSLASN